MKSKDTLLLEEAYVKVFEEENNKVPSEAFENSYCIFVSNNSAKAFHDKIKELGLLEKGVRVLLGDTTACVVIPTELNYKGIEKELHQLPASEEGFWGQFGMGYKGKTWTVLKEGRKKINENKEEQEFSYYSGPAEDIMFLADLDAPNLRRKVEEGKRFKTVFLAYREDAVNYGYPDAPGNHYYVFYTPQDFTHAALIPF